jgi:hypothetical protein
MNGKRLFPIILAAMLLAVPGHTPVFAKDIKLGGEQKLPLTMIVLPRIAVAIRADDGGWRHVEVDCWLAGTDVENAKRLETLKTTIIAKADREFPNRNFEILQSAAEGSNEAKKVIHAAVEAAMGSEWKGQVLIRNMLVY